jgi:plastocyanin
MSIVKRVWGTATAASVLAMIVSLASSSAAAALVAPVSAGPPRPTHVNRLDLNAFFPATTKIHVGDSVSWSINGFHTVSFLATGQTPGPPFVPAVGNLVSGQLDAASTPFWFNGQPKQIINPETAFPSGGKTYNGSGYLNSGTPNPGGPPAPFVVKFTKAGTYAFFCLIHPGMKGVVKVLPKGAHVPTVTKDHATALAEFSDAIAKAHKLGKVKPPPATVLAGNDGSGPVAWLRFFPQNLKIKAGTTVTFKLSSQREVHTITIGPAAYTTAIEKTFTTPQPKPPGPPTLVVNPLGVFPSDPLPLPPYTGTNHGNGFEGSGTLASGGGPLPSSVKITFTKPGVYNYECVIHEHMDGKITVTK